MTQPKVRVALIGAGAMATRYHYPSLSEMPDVEMLAICDLFEDKARGAAEKFNIPKVFTNASKMLDEVEPDAVYVLMPPHHLFDLVVDAMRRKHHVFIEKPPGLNSEQTAHLARHAEKNDCLTMTGFQRRFCPLILEARRRVEERGPIIQCLARFVKADLDKPYYNGAIDILTSDIIHAVDQLRWMGGEVSKIASIVKPFYSEVNNSFNALMEFENGAVGNLVSNGVIGRRFYAVEMHAHKITAYAEPDDRATFYTDNKIEGEDLLATDAAGSPAEHHYLGFFGENRHFIDCIQNKQQPETHFADGIKTMELVERIYRSTL